TRDRRRAGTLTCLPPKGARSGWMQGAYGFLGNEKPGELIVHHFALSSHREVRRDETMGAREPSFAPGYFPRDRAALDPGERAWTDGAAPDRLERDLPGVAVSDAPGLDEHPLADDLDL